MCGILLGFVLFEVFEGGGFFAVAAVFHIALGAAQLGAFARFGNLFRLIVFPVVGGNEPVLPGLRFCHGFGDEVGRVKRRFFRCVGRLRTRVADGGFAFGKHGFAFGCFPPFAFVMPEITRAGVFGSGKTAVCGQAETARAGQDGVGNGLHMDAVDGAGGDAESAAGAFVGDDGVHKFARAHNGIGRAGADTGGAADTGGFVYPGECFGLGFGRCDKGFAEQGGKVADDGCAARGAEVVRFACCDCLCVGQAAVVAAFAALGLGKQAVYGGGCGGHVGVRLKIERAYFSRIVCRARFG